jgi:drug/metabolite transporter (DMT)-like permease/ubiquinone/menaquinone biosynthesis C-methylase UbiE
MKKESIGYLELIISGLLYSFVPILIRFGGSFGVYNLAFFRVFIASFLLGGFFLIYRKKLTPLKYQRKKMIFFGALHGFLILASFVSISLIDISLATLLIYTSPIWTTIFAYFILKEKVTKRIVFALLISFIGIAIIVSSSSIFLKNNFIGICCGIFVGIGAGLIYVLSKSLKEYDSISMTFWQNLIALPFLVPLLFIDLPTFGLKSSLIVLAIGILAIFNFILLFSAFKKISANKGGIFMLLEVIYPIILAYIFFNEQLSLTFILGGILILIGTYISTNSSYRHPFFIPNFEKNIDYGEILKKEKLKFKNNKELEEYYDNKFKKGGYKGKGFKLFDVNISNIYHKHRHYHAQELLSPKKEDVILDAGCSTGELTKRIAKKCSKIIGIDISSAALDLARKNAPKNCIFKHGNIEKIDYPDNYFDKVMCIETLQNTLHPEKVIKELVRVLKKEGCLVVSSCTINKNITSTIERTLRIDKYFSISEHLNEWSFDELKDIFEKRGLVFIKASGVVFNLGKGIFYLQRLSKRLGLLIHKLSLSITRFPRNSGFVVMSFKKIKSPR